MPALRIIGLSLVLWAVILVAGYVLGGWRGVLIAIFLTLAGGAVSALLSARAIR